MQCVNVRRKKKAIYPARIRPTKLVAELTEINEDPCASDNPSQVQ